MRHLKALNRPVGRIRIQDSKFNIQNFIGIKVAKSFEESDVWKKARELVNHIYLFTRKKEFSRDHSLTDQVRRSAVSVMSNIAEGFERGSNTEFIQFLYIAKGSAGEVRSQLTIAMDQGYITSEEFLNGKALCLSVSGQLSGFIRYLKDCGLKGEKYNGEPKHHGEEVSDVVEAYLEGSASS
jgi:four helix bundle protein